MLHVNKFIVVYSLTWINLRKILIFLTFCCHYNSNVIFIVIHQKKKIFLLQKDKKAITFVKTKEHKLTRKESLTTKQIL